MAARLDAYLLYDQDDPRAETDLQTPWGIKLLSGGAITKGNLTVTVGETPEVSQPGPFSDGETVELPRTDLLIEEEDRALTIVNGAVNLFSDATGLLEALVDFTVVTKWKTAGDSLLVVTPSFNLAELSAAHDFILTDLPPNGPALRRIHAGLAVAALAGYLASRR
mgnify:CR=1 FL=1